MKKSAKMDSILEYLKTVDFLAGVPSTILLDIGKQLVEVVMPRGSEIFPDESPGDAMYFIVDGEVQLEKRGHWLLSRGRGEYIGEMALVDEAGRSAAAVCGSDVKLLRWDKEDFRRTLIANGYIAYQVCRAFSAKIRESVESATSFKQDLSRAVQLQRAMLPKSTYSDDLLTLAAHCSQAEEIGGDYYDYLSFGGKEMALIIADAQGHGYSAALLVAMLKARLYSQVRRNRSPDKIVEALSDTLSKSIDEVHMATCCYILVDGVSQTFHYCSAGHVPQFHCRVDLGRVDILESTSLILGFEQPHEGGCRVESRTWHAGDYLILCTDGVMEAKNARGEEFGVGRVMEAIKKVELTEPREVQEKLRATLENYCGRSTFDDDVTLVAVRLEALREGQYLRGKHEAAS